MLSHILIVSRGDRPREPLELLLAEFARGIEGCPGVLRVHWGENTNATGLARGYDYVCATELVDLQTMRTAYWEHPAHRDLLERLPDLCEARFALDIED
jgi:hypothetical protein